MSNLQDHSRIVLAWYIRNALRHVASAFTQRLSLERLPYLTEYSYENAGEDDLSDIRIRRRKLRELRAILKAVPRFLSLIEIHETNANHARKEFSLDAVDMEILLLLLRYGRDSELEKFVDDLTVEFRNMPRTIAVLIGVDSGEVVKRISPSGALVKSGLVVLNDESQILALSGGGGYMRLAAPLKKIMYRPFNSSAEWTEAILGPPLKSFLAWEDFEHLGELRTLVMKTLTGACQTHSRGINLLFHGCVGTGKTEFCKVAAAQAGLRLWAVGETDEQGNEPTRSERLASLQLMQRLLSRHGNAAILFDEADDVFVQKSFMGLGLGHHGRNESKVYFNRLLELNTVPVLWTCNDADAMEPSIVRRMSLSVEMKTPDAKVREKIWKRVLNDFGCALSKEDIVTLSQEYAAPPAVIANAVRAASLAKGGLAEIRAAMKGSLNILGIRTVQHEAADGENFDPDFVNCADDLSLLADRLQQNRQASDWSLCIHGAPGTGKSFFARTLALRLGYDILQYRASDLLSKWVGDSEKRIAAAFSDARARRAMLIIDEADSLLSDRRYASQSWEISQINEMLTWMESHPLPFVCTTNLVERLDLASFRRFTFKLKFEKLPTAQAEKVFQKLFGVKAPARLPDGLTPGHFKIARRKQHVLGVTDPAILAQWLSAESAIEGSSQRIGFLS